MNTEEKLTAIEINYAFQEMEFVLKEIYAINIAIKSSKVMSRITAAYPYGFGKYLEEASTYFHAAHHLLQGIKRRLEFSGTHLKFDDYIGQDWCDDIGNPNAKA